MKKAIVFIMVALIACTAVFAEGLRMGVDQSLVTTSVSLSYDFGRWAEVGGSIGASWLGIGECSDSFQKGTDPWYVSIARLGALPRAEVFADFKVVDTAHFDFRVGARGTAQGIFFAEEDNLVAFFAGPKAEISYKFNDDCRIYLNGYYPMLGTGLGDGGLGSAFYLLFIGIFDQVAHLGVSWSL